jgi:hypothetical protein
MAFPPPGLVRMVNQIGRLNNDSPPLLNLIKVQPITNWNEQNPGIILMAHSGKACIPRVDPNTTICHFVPVAQPETFPYDRWMAE